MTSGMSFIILAAILFLFSVYIGFQLGVWAGDHAVTRRDYWMMNAAAVGIAIVVTVFIGALPLLYPAVVGALAGAIVGLKMAFGESVGPWKVLDRFLNINKSHRRTAHEGTGEERRKRKRAGEDGPDLISVESKKKQK